MNWCARKKIRAAINHHWRMRDSIMYARNQDPISMYEYNDHMDELWHRAAAELRCINRLEKLLTKYKSK